MLAALLLNRIGNTAGKTLGRVDEVKAQRALDNLRKEHFAREREKKEQIKGAVTVDGNVHTLPKEVYRIPSANLLSGRAGDSKRLEDEELALLLIIAQL